MEHIKELIEHPHKENRALGCQLARSVGTPNGSIFNMLIPKKYEYPNRGNSTYTIGDFSFFIIERPVKSKFQYIFAIKEGDKVVKKCTVSRKDKKATFKFYSKKFMELILA